MEENTKTYTAEQIDAIDGSLPIYQLLEMDPGNAAILMALTMFIVYKNVRIVLHAPTGAHSVSQPQTHRTVQS